MIKKYTIFREMQDYMAANAEVTDADMNRYNYNNEAGMRIVGETETEIVTIEVTIKKKEEHPDAETLE